MPRPRSVFSGYTNEELEQNGIYCIVNTVNWDFYIGSATVGFYSRWMRHIGELKNHTHHNPRFQRGWDKYGMGVYRFDILDAIDDKELALDKEQEWLDSYFGDEHCINIRSDATSMLGIVISDDVRKRIGETHRSNWQNPAYREEQRIKTDNFKHIAIATEASKKYRAENQEKFRQSIVAAFEASRKPEIIEKRTATLKVFNQTAEGQAVIEKRIMKLAKNHGKFVSPAGEIVEIINLEKFAKNLGFSPTGFAKLRDGKVKQTHGWTRYQG